MSLQEVVQGVSALDLPLEGGHRLLGAPASAAFGGRRGPALLLSTLLVPESGECVTSNYFVLAECRGGVLGSVHLPCASRGLEAMSAALGELSAGLDDL